MAARVALALLLAALTLMPAASAQQPQQRVRNGLWASSWRLQPGTIVTPERRVFRILVTEVTCASGQPATGRVEEPLVIREPERVQVAMFVRPVEGPATCPSNPPTPYVLRLERPLGDRTLADGGTIPPRPVRGALTRRAYQRAIWRIRGDTGKANRLFDALVTRPGRPVAECSRMMRDFTGEVGRLLSRVQALDAPPAVAGIQRDFLDAAWQSWHRLEKVGAAVAAGRVRCGPDLNDRIYGMASTERAERAIARLERRGYQVYGE